MSRRQKLCEKKTFHAISTRAAGTKRKSGHTSPSRPSRDGSCSFSFPRPAAKSPLRAVARCLRRSITPPMVNRMIYRPALYSRSTSFTSITLCLELCHGIALCQQFANTESSYRPSASAFAKSEVKSFFSFPACHKDQGGRERCRFPACSWHRVRIGCVPCCA